MRFQCKWIPKGCESTFRELKCKRRCNWHLPRVDDYRMPWSQSANCKDSRRASAYVGHSDQWDSRFLWKSNLQERGKNRNGRPVSFQLLSQISISGVPLIHCLINNQQWNQFCFHWFYSTFFFFMLKTQKNKRKK